MRGTQRNKTNAARDPCLSTCHHPTVAKTNKTQFKNEQKCDREKRHEGNEKGQQTYAVGNMLANKPGLCGSTDSSALFADSSCPPALASAPPLLFCVYRFR